MYNTYEYFDAFAYMNIINVSQTGNDVPKSQQNNGIPNAQYVNITW